MRLEDAKFREPQDFGERKMKRQRSSAYTDDYIGEYYNIAVEKLIPFKRQARYSFDEGALEAMASTIRQYGVLQPLTVIASEEEEGKYEIVSGERRYRASLLADLSVLPCIILHDYKKAIEIAIIENIQRENLHPVELMQAYDNLLKEGFCFSLREIAHKLGVAKSSVVEILNLRRLHKKVRDLLLQHKIINREFIRSLLKADNNNQEEMVMSFVSNIKVKKIQKALPKRRVLSIIVNVDGSFDIEKFDIDSLNTTQQYQIKEMLKDMVNNIFR